MLFRSGSIYFSFCLLVSSLSDFHPDTRGGGGHFFRLTCSVTLLGGMLQITLACARSASATLVLPLLTASVASCPHCSGSRLLHLDPSAAGPGLLAPPRSKLLRFRHLGSSQRCRLSWACVLCPSQVQAAQVMRCLVSAIAATYRLPAAQLLRCTTGTPSQADVDHPDPQEVLVSKEACLQFYR